MKLEGRKRVHFIGMGGAGMSAIAKVLIERGRAVSGSDLKSSPALSVLSAMGARVHIGHQAALVEGADLVVVSSAIPATNPELARAQDLGIEVITRGEALAAVLEDRRAIVVAGTHGKTTTTSMIVSILDAAGEDPTYLVGGGLNDAGTNARDGRGGLAVAESDESDGSFLLLDPHIAVVTNIEIDHVDRWASLEELHAAFRDFIARVPPEGAVVAPAVLSAMVAGTRALTFGGEGVVTARDVRFVGSRSGGSTFTLITPAGDASVELRVPGEHNIANSLAAAAACIAAGTSLEAIAAGLGRFTGVERRWQLKGTAAGVTVIDDYAHHPTEVRATLQAALVGPWERVIAVFQPHRYSRTAALAHDFGGAFDLADKIVVTDVYGAGEEAVPGVTGKVVVDEITARLRGRTVAYLPHRGELIGYLVRGARPGDLLLTLGAGDVTTLGDEVLERLGSAA